MNRNNRTYLLITSQLDRLEAAAANADQLPSAEVDAVAMDAVGLLDELRRLRRKWDEQAAQNDPRRTMADFHEHDVWVRRWTLALKKLLPGVKDASISQVLRANLTPP